MMRCLGCEYDLRGLSSGCCPECGQLFNPADPATYRSEAFFGSRVPKPLALVFAVASAFVPALEILTGHLALVIARLALGRWPDRMGADDPKYINSAVGFLNSLWMLLTVMLLPSLLAWIVFSVVVMMPIRDDESASRLIVLRKPIILLTFCVWLAAMTIIMIDPARVGVWMLD